MIFTEVSHISITGNQVQSQALFVLYFEVNTKYPWWFYSKAMDFSQVHIPYITTIIKGLAWLVYTLDLLVLRAQSEPESGPEVLVSAGKLLKASLKTYWIGSSGSGAQQLINKPSKWFWCTGVWETPLQLTRLIISGQVNQVPILIWFTLSKYPNLDHVMPVLQFKLSKAIKVSYFAINY